MTERDRAATGVKAASATALRKRTRVRVAIAIGVTLILLAAGGELAARHAYERRLGQLMTVEDPEQLLTRAIDDARLYGLKRSMPFKSNAHGFADAERTIQKPDGVFRIALLGDSVTQQQGYRRADTYARALELKLERALPELDIEILNFGVTGYSTVQTVELWLREAALYAPDLLLLQVHHNDALDPILDEANGGLGMYYAKPRCYAARFWAQRLHQRKRRAWIEQRALQELSLDLQAQKYAAAEQERLLMRLAASAQQLGVRAAAFVFPTVPAAVEWSTFDGLAGEVHRELVERLRGAGFSAYDPLDAFRTMPIKEYRLGGLDPWHCSPAAYNELARELARWLAELIPLQSK